VNYLSDEITPLERLETVFNLGEVDRLPAVQPLQTGTIELMKDSGFFWPDAHRDPVKMAGLSYASHEVIGFESVRIPFDTTMEAEALGCALNWRPGRLMPSIKAPLIKDIEMIDKIDVPDVRKAGRLPIVMEAGRILSAKTRPEKIPLISGIVGPFMIASQLRGIEHFLVETFEQPDLCHKSVEVATKLCIEYAQEMEKAGADVITLADISSTDLVSPSDHDAFSRSYNERIIKSSDLPFVLHICGDTNIILNSLVSTGAKAVSIDAMVDMAELKRIATGKCAAAGNISVVRSLFKGNPEAVIEDTRMAIMKGADIPCGSCGFVPRTSNVNLKTMVSAIKKYGVRN
jgi:[methyl-Co(III) methanol-specific corrinoid protein]:coenzyme M methyltransferase